MSKYVSPTGYSDESQCLVWHYKTDIDRNVLNRWFVNVFNHGVVYYIPDPDTDTSPSTAGGTTITIPIGTSFLIKQKDIGVLGVSGWDGDKIAKGDMVRDFDIDISGYADDTYNIVGVWENDADETRGIEFYLYTDAEVITNLTGDNYIIFGQVEVAGGIVISNTATAQTQGSMYSGLAGWSGWSGYIGATGTSGWSGVSSFSGVSGLSGYSGTSGVSGAPDTGPSGWSGISGYSGVSGTSGISGFSGFSGVVGTSGWSGSTNVSFVYSGADTIDENNLIIIPVYRGVGQTNAVTLKLWGKRFPTFHYTELPGHDHSAAEFATVAHTHIQNQHRHDLTETVTSGAGAAHKHTITFSGSTATTSLLVGTGSASPHSHAAGTLAGSIANESSHTHSVVINASTDMSLPTNQDNTEATVLASDGIVPSTTTVNTIEKDFLTVDLATTHVGIYVDTSSETLGTRYTIVTGGKWADLVNLNQAVGATIDIMAEAPANGYFFIKMDNTEASHGSKILWHVAIN